MKVALSSTRTFLLTEIEALDPVTIFLQDYGRSGHVTIECYGKAWTTYFGNYGEGTLQKFVAEASPDYLINRFQTSNLPRSFEKQEKAYLSRIVKSVQQAFSQEET
jgi:hypothetical protein